MVDHDGGGGFGKGCQIMSCKCAVRMRRLVLPYFGYYMIDGVWRHEGKQDIPDTEIEEHYTRTTAKLLADFGVAKCQAFYDKLKGEMKTEQERLVATDGR